MTISIPFPTDFSANSYADIKSYLKQLELSVRHAQKAVESAESSGITLTENAFVAFRHPLLENDILAVHDEALKDFASNHYEELQRVELEISLN